MHFNNNKIKPAETILLIDNNGIQSVHSAKFLGVMFDYELSFQNHIAYVQEKTNRANNIITFLTWERGGDPTPIRFSHFIKVLLDLLWIMQALFIILKVRKRKTF